MNVLVTRRLPGEGEKKLRAHFSQVVFSATARPMSREELKNQVAGADILICSLTDRIDAEILAAASSLKCLITFSAGTDHLDTEALKARKIRVVHTPGVLTDATADLTWALILACARRIKPALHYTEEGKFSGFDASLFMGMELNGAVLGIVGMGKIGYAVASRALGFGMKILYCGSERTDITLPGRHVELAELLRLSDIVSLHCPLTPKTKHLIGRRELSTMKPRAVLINAARGPVVDEKVLLAHLRTHPEFFAGLDVYENEPEITQGLAGLPNSVCVPHIGSATESTRNAMTDICVEEAIRFAKGERLRYEYVPGL